MASRREPSTLSNYDAVKVSHMRLVLTVDMEAKVLRGRAEFTATVEADEGADAIVFDTNHLDITRVHCDGTEAASASARAIAARHVCVWI